MDPQATLHSELKSLLVENLMLQTPADQIADDLPLFGPGGLGLDSVDALQIVVMLDRNYGLKIADPAVAREVLRSVSSMAEALMKSGLTRNLIVTGPGQGAPAN
ncbi:MAG: acyl carrier protein [Verrucomicrobiales bacterium]|nr:acyl carrier protein [Verrucomicrobiales bacterium]